MSTSTASLNQKPLARGIRSTRGTGLSTQRKILGALFALPTVVMIVTFFLVPLGMTFWMSFHRWPLLGTHKWIGLENYATALSDPNFLQALKFTLEYTVIITPILLVFGFGLAVLVRRGDAPARFFQSVYFMPVAIGLASASFLWLFMTQSQIGPLWDLLRRIGLISSTSNLFAGHWSSLMVVNAMVTWKVVGLQMLLLLSGLQSIPDEVNEAARVDGASGWQRLWHITVPLLRPTLALVLVFSVAGSLLAFDQFYIMTSGGPSNSTITAVYAIYRNSFIQFKLGYGAALSVLLMVILAIVSAIQMLLLRNTDHT
ncbi:MAG TPA: sugar ABC transporter permease [Propionibacteriaceae bacterium]|nr:sugar ABC transporter permease [Propionibacteriaceae bacterium]